MKQNVQFTNLINDEEEIIMTKHVVSPKDVSTAIWPNGKEEELLFSLIPFVALADIIVPIHHYFLQINHSTAAAATTTTTMNCKSKKHRFCVKLIGI